MVSMRGIASPRRSSSIQRRRVSAPARHAVRNRVETRNVERRHGRLDRDSTRRRQTRVEKLGWQDETIRPTGNRPEPVVAVERCRRIVDGIDDHVPPSEIARADGGATPRARQEMRTEHLTVEAPVEHEAGDDVARDSVRELKRGATRAFSSTGARATGWSSAASRSSTTSVGTVIDTWARRSSWARASAAKVTRAETEIPSSSAARCNRCPTGSEGPLSWV